MTFYFYQRDIQALEDRKKLRKLMETDEKKPEETEVERINRLWKTIQDAART